MITRSNLAEQLREYQVRSKYDWASFSFSASSASTSSRFCNLYAHLTAKAVPSSICSLLCLCIMIPGV
ncbi:hypothetical protein Taro_055475 [Colocasia esculenta]|uniref:Uncharacterized protein n=1 Tax=Colocasia esculenta TaxID=4460 RepID=A0A843XTJ2_COLES|nr:hypothetical protein [Colocasia esculenta]